MGVGWSKLKSGCPAIVVDVIYARTQVMQEVMGEWSNHTTRKSFTVCYKINLSSMSD